MTGPNSNDDGKIDDLGGDAELPRLDLSALTTTSLPALKTPILSLSRSWCSTNGASPSRSLCPERRFATATMQNRGWMIRMRGSGKLPVESDVARLVGRI